MEGFIISLICSSLLLSTNEGQACLKGSEAIVVYSGLRTDFKAIEQGLERKAQKNIRQDVGAALGTAYTIKRYNGIFYSGKLLSSKVNFVNIIGPNHWKLELVYNY